MSYCPICNNRYTPPEEIKAVSITCELTWTAIDDVEGTVLPVKIVCEIFGGVIKSFYLYIMLNQ